MRGRASHFSLFSIAAGSSSVQNVALPTATIATPTESDLATSLDILANTAINEEELNRMVNEINALVDSLPGPSEEERQARAEDLIADAMLPFN